MDASEDCDRLTSIEQQTSEDCSYIDSHKQASTNLETSTSKDYVSGSSSHERPTASEILNFGNNSNLRDPESTVIKYYISDQDPLRVPYNSAIPDDAAVRLLAVSDEKNSEDAEDIETLNERVINDVESDDEESGMKHNHPLLRCTKCCVSLPSRRVEKWKIVVTTGGVIFILMASALLLAFVFASKQASSISATPIPPPSSSAPSTSAPAMSPFYSGCSNLSSIPNSDVNCTNGTFEGSNCTFTCNSNREILGVETLSCVDSKWSDDLPSCVCPNCSAGDYCEYSNEIGPVIQRVKNNEEIIYERFPIRCANKSSFTGWNLVWRSSCTDVVTGISAECSPCAGCKENSGEAANIEATLKLIRIMIEQGYYPYPCDPDSMEIDCGLGMVAVTSILCVFLSIFLFFLLYYVWFCYGA